jgi:hypothetical protein
MRYYSWFWLVVCLPACSTQPTADSIYQSLPNGKARIIVNMDDEPFYPDDSQFKGEVTVTAQTIRLNLFDQYESNVIISLDAQDLFAQRPVQRTITPDNQIAGSVMIGRVRDRKQRTGDGFLMQEGSLVVEKLADTGVVIRFSGMIANFNTLRDRRTWKHLEGLLVYRKPTINVPARERGVLLY